MTEQPLISTKALWIGRIMSAIPALMLLFSATMKFIQPPGMEEGLAHIGIPLQLVIGLGILQMSCTVLYLIPRTAVLGAILLTGYMGGAILTHLRVGDPIYAQAIFGVLIWGGLYLREPRLRTLIPFRR